MYFDTHAHYDSSKFAEDRDEVIRAAYESGVSLIVDPGDTLERSKNTVALAEQYDFIYAAVGVHPEDMASMTPAERAAAWGLPAPPEGIDLSDREFKLANAYNSITDQRPNHSYGAGVVVDKVASAGFNAFVEAARAAGYYVTAYSGYVDYWTALENYYQPNVAAYGAEKASKITLVPGCNDHQTALGIDLRMGSADYESSKDFRGTEAWDWLLEHCAEYGVILRYPEGQEQWYGTACMHPCHFRYVGETAARYIMDNNITLEQFMLLYDWDIIYVPGVN